MVGNTKNDYLTGDSSFLIDIIRVLACEMVVFCHPAFIYDEYFSLAKNNTNLLYVLDLFLGNTGVILFFIVSGIVISNSLFKKMDESKSYSFVNFFIDRFSRIYSGLVPGLIFISLCDIALLKIDPSYFNEFGSSGFSVSAFLGSLFMLQNLPLIGTLRPSFGGVIWTLNIEWWLYLLFGWFVLNFKRETKLSAFSIVPLLLFAFYPLYLFLVNSYENLPLVWFMGVAAAVININNRMKSWDWRLDCAIVALIAMIIGKLWLIYFLNKMFYDLTLEILLTLLIIILMAKLKNTNIFTNTKIKRAIKFMGKYSFTLYLIHYAIENLIFALYVTLGIKYPVLFVFIVAVVVANIVAFLIAYPTEMRYKELAKLLNGFLGKLRAYTLKVHNQQGYRN